VRLSSVELARKSASCRAVRQAIGRQFRDEYDTSQPLPAHLVGLLQLLERDEQGPPKSAQVELLEGAAEQRSHLLKLVEEATEKRSRMASLLSGLSTKRAALVRAIEDACETRQRIRQLRRQMRRSRMGLSWA
jgi:chemotaxis protein histidine kinase CheA